MSLVIKNLVKSLNVDEKNGNVYLADGNGKGNSQKGDKFVNVVKGTTYPIEGLTFIEGSDDNYMIPDDMSGMYLGKGNKVIGLPDDDYLVENWKLASVDPKNYVRNTRSERNTSGGRSSGRKPKVTIKEKFKRSKSDSRPTDAIKATLNTVIPYETTDLTKGETKDLENIVNNVEKNTASYDDLFYLLDILGIRNEVVIGGKNPNGVSMGKIYVRM